MNNLAQTKLEIERLARLIEAGPELLPTYGFSDGSGRPHVEVDASGYHYVESERGHEFDRWTTQELDELLFAVFRSVTFQMATEYELRHRVADKEPRRVIFPRQIELMSILSAKWAERLSIEKEKIVRLFPFDDNAHLRAVLTKELRDQGHSPEDAWRIACEKYPNPTRGTIEDGKHLRLELRKMH
jgi:hypothetical protein